MYRCPTRVGRFQSSDSVGGQILSMFNKDDYVELADDYIPTGRSALESANSELESANSSVVSNADPPKIGEGRGLYGRD